VIATTAIMIAVPAAHAVAAAPTRATAAMATLCCCGTDAQRQHGG
jgi:hypothetical protein